MSGLLDAILNVILLIFSISAVVWGLYGFVYRGVISKKYKIRYLEVEMPALYEILFWVIIIPFFIVSTIIILF